MYSKLLMRRNLEQCKLMNTVQQNAVSRQWVVKCPSKLQSCCSQDDILYCFSFRLEFLQWEGFALRSAEKTGVLSNGCIDSSTDGEQKVPCPQRPMTRVLSLLHSVLFTCWCLRLPSTVVPVIATSWLAFTSET